MAAFLPRRYRDTVGRINREDRTRGKGARMSLVGAVRGGTGSTVVRAAVAFLPVT